MDYVYLIVEHAFSGYSCIFNPREKLSSSASAFMFPCLIAAAPLCEES